MKKRISLNNRKAAFVELKDWCVMSCGPDREEAGDFLEVTQWTNGEGYDVFLGSTHLEISNQEATVLEILFSHMRLIK
jgi:hypothetical protein